MRISLLCDREYVVRDQPWIRKQLHVPNPHHPITTGFQERGSLRIVFAISGFIVLTTVQLDNQLYAMTCEIRDIRADRRLPPEMKSLTFKLPKVTPKQSLCVGSIAS